MKSSAILEEFKKTSVAVTVAMTANREETVGRLDQLLKDSGCAPSFWRGEVHSYRFVRYAVHPGDRPNEPVETQELIFLFVEDSKEAYASLEILREEGLVVSWGREWLEWPKISVHNLGGDNFHLPSYEKATTREEIPWWVKSAKVGSLALLWWATRH